MSFWDPINGGGEQATAKPVKLPTESTKPAQTTPQSDFWGGSEIDKKYAQPTDQYFYKKFDSGATVGRADELDIKGRPYLGYRNPGDMATTTDKTRTASEFDPTIAQPLTKEQYYNPRADGLRESFAKKYGITPSQQLDHAIALAVGGSNDQSNLRAISTEENQEAGKFESELARKLVRGEISYFDAQKADAEHKGVKAPWTPPDLEKPEDPKKGFWSKTGDFLEKILSPKEAEAQTIEQPQQPADQEGFWGGLKQPPAPTDTTKAPAASAPSLDMAFPPVTGFKKAVRDLGSAILGPQNKMDSTQSNEDNLAQTLHQVGTQLGKDALKLDQADPKAIEGFNGRVARYNELLGQYNRNRNDVNAPKPPLSTMEYLPSELASHIPFIGGFIKSVQDDPESAAKINLTWGDLGYGAVETGKGIVHQIASYSLTAYGATSALLHKALNTPNAPGVDEDGNFNLDIILNNVPGKPSLGHFQNVQSRIAEDYKNNPVPANAFSTAMAVAKYTGEEFLNGLFAASLVAGVVNPRISAITRTGDVKVPKGFAGEGSTPQSFRSYEPKVFQKPIAPEVFAKITGENSIPVRATYDPKLPTYFEASATAPDTLTGRFVQVKPSYMSEFIKKFGGDISKVPSNQLIPISQIIRNAVEDIKMIPNKQGGFVRIGEEGDVQSNQLANTPKSRFKTGQDLVNYVSAKGSGGGAALNVTEMRQLVDHLTAGGDESKTIDTWGGKAERGTVYKSYGGGTDVVLGKVKSPVFGDSMIVAQLNKNGKLDGHFRIHGTPIDEDKIITKLGNQGLMQLTAPDKASSNSQETHTIDTPERQQMRQEIANTMYGKGALKQQLRADIVMGLPGSGKTTIGSSLAREHGSLLIEGDDVAKHLPEYANGKGASLVHREASRIAQGPIIEKAMVAGDNIVLPTVGRFKNKLLQRIDALKEAGYDVHIHYPDVSLETAKQRLAKRTEQGGHPIPDDLMTSKTELDIRDAYDSVKEYEAVTSARQIKEDRISTESQGAGREVSSQLGRGVDNGNGDRTPAEEKREEVETPTEIRADREDRLAIEKGVVEMKKIDAQTSRKVQLDRATPEERAAMKDERALGRIAKRQEKHISELIHKERVIKAVAACKKKAEEAHARKTTLQEKIDFEKARGSKPNTLFSALKQKLFPVKVLDAKTQSIVEDWYTDLGQATEDAQIVYNELRTKGTQNFGEVMDYEAGSKTQYIREAEDDIFTRARRAGIQIHYTENHIMHVWDKTGYAFMAAVRRYLKSKGMSPEEIEGYINGKTLDKDKSIRLKLRPDFSKERIFPTYAKGMEFGLRPKFDSPAKIIAYETHELNKTIANKQFIDTLKSEAKLLTEEDKPDSWIPVNARFARNGGQTLYASPRLAEFINGRYRDEENLSALQIGFRALSTFTRGTTHFVLTTGIPFTNIHSYGIGIGLYKPLTTALGAVSEAPFRALFGDLAGSKGKMEEAVIALKQSVAFLRSNSTSWSVRFMNENSDTLVNMARVGLSMPGRSNYYNKIGDSFWKGMLNSGGDIIAAARDLKETPIDASKEIVATSFKTFKRSWNRFFAEQKTWELVNQQQVILFRDTLRAAKRNGMDDETALQFTAEVTKKAMGTPDVPNSGRSTNTEEQIISMFLVPQYREGVMNVLWNGFKGSTWKFRDRRFSFDRSLIVGAAVTFVLYNLMNHRLNGHYMWDNPAGREFSIRIPLSDGGALYTDMMPSLLTVPRNLLSGAFAFAKGDWDVAAQKASSIFSMPLNALVNAISNRDYFGRPIYNEADDFMTKSEKSTMYMTGQMTTPVITEMYRYYSGSQTGTETLVRLAQLPVRFSKPLSERYAAMQALYEKNEKLKAENKKGQADANVQKLTPEEWKIYKSVRSREQSKQTTARRSAIENIYDDNQKLKAEGDAAEANRVYWALSEQDQRIYDNISRKDPNRKL